jgi:membrane peptidoglycan carboxypeptidase
MGIATPLGRNLSLSLGTSEVTLFQLTSAYTVFPNGGVHLQPTLVKRVEDRFGNILEDNSEIPVLDADSVPTPTQREEFGPLESGVTGVSGAARGARREAVESKAPTSPSEAGGAARPEERQRAAVAAISPQTAYVLTDMMLSGVRSGTGARMNQYIRRKDIAGKTGTTNHAEDAWFVGFTPDVTAGVWVGFDEKRPLGLKEEGGRAALPIWGHLMKDVLANVKQRDFPVPPDMAFPDLPTFSGNPKDGFTPKLVREPVYAPFVGRTLVVSPLDPPEIFTAYSESSPPPSTEQPGAVQSRDTPNRAGPPAADHLLRPLGERAGPTHGNWGGARPPNTPPPAVPHGTTGQGSPAPGQRGTSAPGRPGSSIHGPQGLGASSTSTRSPTVEEIKRIAVPAAAPGAGGQGPRDSAPGARTHHRAVPPPPPDRPTQ